MAFKININGFIGESGFFESDSFSLKNLNDALAGMPTNETEIEVLINSGGGDVNEGFAIYDRLAALPQKVNTVVLGMCGSIATIIAQAGKKGTRSIYENSEYFIHNPSWVPGWENGFDAAQLQAITDELVKNEQKILDFYVTNTGQKKSILSAKMKDAKMLTAEEAKDLGFIDSIISTKIAAMKRYRLVACVTPTEKKELTMDGLAQKFMSALDALDKKITSAIGGGKIKNETAKSDEGTTLYYTGSLVVGTKVYTDEAMTAAAPDGTYTISNVKYTVAGGAITESTPASTAKATVEQLTAELDKTKAELKTAQDNLKAANEGKTQAEKTLTDISAEFKNFKDTFVTGGKLKPEYEQPVKGDESAGQPKPGTMAAVLAKRQAEAKAKAEAEAAKRK